MPFEEKTKHTKASALPLVSIVTPSYNSASYIQETVASIRKQTHTNWEHIIIDDCSNDQTPELLKEIAKQDPRVTVIFLEKNSGSAVARNRGIEQAKGTYLTFIDSDDIWFPDFISNSIATIRKTKIPFVYSSYRRSNEALEFVYSDFIVPETVTYTDILKSNSISCLTAFLHVESLGKKKMPLVRKRQDMGLWLQYLKEIPFAKGILEPKAIYRIRENSLSRNKKQLITSQWYFYRNIEKISVVKSMYYMLCWMYYGFMKYRN